MFGGRRPPPEKEMKLLAAAGSPPENEWVFFGGLRPLKNVFELELNYCLFSNLIFFHFFSSKHHLFFENLIYFLYNLFLKPNLFFETQSIFRNPIYFWKTLLLTEKPRFLTKGNMSIVYISPIWHKMSMTKGKRKYSLWNEQLSCSDWVICMI